MLDLHPADRRAEVGVAVEIVAPGEADRLVVVIGQARRHRFVAARLQRSGGDQRRAGSRVKTLQCLAGEFRLGGFHQREQERDGVAAEMIRHPAATPTAADTSRRSAARARCDPSGRIHSAG